MSASQLSEILPYLFVGPAIEATRILRENPYQIKRVICVIESPLNVGLEEKVEAVKRLHMFNEDWSFLEKTFGDVFAFIDSALQEEQNTLVHCMNGQNRSVALVIAYLIHERNMGFEEAHQFVKKKHPQAELSQCFEERLRNYATQYTSSL